MKKIKLTSVLNISYILIITAAISIIVSVVFSVVKLEMIQQIGESRIDVLKQVAERTNTIHNSMVMLSDLYYQDPLFDSICRDDTRDDDILRSQFKSLENTASTITQVSGLKFDSYIALKDGRSFINGVLHKDRNLYNEFQQKLWLKNVLDNNREITWISTKYSDIFNQQPMIGAARCITPDNHTDVKGIFIIILPEQSLRNTYIDLAGNTSVYIIDQNGKIVSDSDDQRIGFQFYNMKKFHSMFQDRNYEIIEKSGEDYLFSRNQISQFGWTVVEEIKLSTILAPLNVVQSYLFLSAASALTLGIFLIYIITRQITKPIQILCGELDQIGYDLMNDCEVLTCQGWTEVNQISDKCNLMLRRIHDLMAGIQTMENKKIKAEQKFLRAQIQPHFMYNTLFSIKCMIEIGKNPEADKMLNSFMVLLRHSMGSEDELIPLDWELKVLGEYIYIQQVRFNNTFDCQINCSEALKQCRIPILILQPIIENSIQHGINTCSRGGHIMITIANCGDNLVADIFDNGSGMTQEEILEVTDVSNACQSNRGHIGISNVIQRIHLLFGEKYGLSIQSEPGTGTHVYITLPFFT